MITVDLARPGQNAWVHMLHDAAFGDMTIADYMQWISQRNRRVYVISDRDAGTGFATGIGFAMVRLGRDAATICKIAIIEQFRRQGIATEAIRQITAKHGKRLTRAAAKEPDAIAQDFFRSLGMRLKMVDGKPGERFWIFEGTNKERAKR
jgi:ribosomal protein S18 acetylase RimI-like enzyme